MVEAERAYDRIATAIEGVSFPTIRAGIVAEFRNDARRHFWLYPLIEARRGVPA